MRTTTATFVALATLAMAPAQESFRDLDRPGEHHKHLTRDTIDHWKIVAEPGEVFRVEVSSQEFDPVLEFVTADGEVLREAVDDPGSTSKFLARVERAGDYEILVHGPDQRGGGNYRLHVERFVATPMGAERRVESTFDRDGFDNVRFEAEAGEILVPVGVDVTQVIDPKGVGVPEWGGSYTISENGEHYVRVRGGRGRAYGLRVLAARHRELSAAEVAAGVDRSEEVEGRGLDVWGFDGRVGDFRTVELTHPRPCQLRVVWLDDGESSDQLQKQPELQSVPVHSKGDRQRSAFLLGRTGRFQIQVLSTVLDANSYQLKFGDPTETTRLGAAVAGRLAIGDSAFYTFDAEPGQLVQVDVTSEHFDPLTSVKRPDGTDIGGDDDGGGDLSSRYTFLVREDRTFRIHVACYGNGGGGDYSVGVRELEIPTIEVGGARQHTYAGPGDSYWHFAGRAGQVVFVGARSDSMDMSVSVHGPTGILLGSDDDAGAGRDALLALRLPADGRYTIVAHNQGGSGSCRVQVLDPDAGSG